MSHWCWSFAAQLFEDLARKGLCTASAIEREYRRDEDLMWRLFACGARATELTGILWGLVRQTVSYCEHYRPYFKRWRVNKDFPIWPLSFAYFDSAAGP